MSSLAIERADTLAEAFRWHVGNCHACAGVSLARPATLAGACLEGSRIAKDLAQANLAASRERERIAVKEARSDRGRAA